MSDSLVIANAIELLGGGVLSSNPLCAGVEFRLQPGFDIGAPQPTTDYVSTLILDGERPFGRRSGNRVIKLPILIIAPSRQLLAAGREILEQAIDQDTWTLTWIRDPGLGGTELPLIIDCFRAQPTVPIYNTQLEKQLCMAQIQLTIPALPFGRSNAQVQTSFAAPVPQTPPAPPPPVVLDNYSTITSNNFFQSLQCAIGPYSACWDPDTFGDPGGQSTPLQYSATFTSPLNLTGMQAVVLYFGLGSRYATKLDFRGRTNGVSLYLTLTDDDGVQLAFSRSNQQLPVTSVAQNPVFTRITMTMPTSTTFDYTNVVSYNLTIVNRQDSDLLRLQWVTAYLDALTAYPSSQTSTPVVRGNLHTLYGLIGTARSPCSLSFQQPPTAGTPTTITATGVGNYTVPANTAWLKVETIGGGGPGASRTTSGFGGGGSGSEYAREDLFSCSPGDVIPYSVGLGGTPGASPIPGAATIFGPGPAGPMIVQANGGQPALQNSILGAIGATGSLNTIHFNGGNGRTASGSVGGGGGGSGGTASAGLAPVGTAAVVFTASGSGTWTCPPGVFQVFAEVWGSGGSGATGGASSNGSAGGGGEYAADYINVTPGIVYNYVVGTGGIAITVVATNGNAGSNSTFTGDAGAVVTAHGGGGGISSYTGNPGQKGTGSTNRYHYDGGYGGPCNPYSGSGGSCAGPSSGGNNGNGYGSAPAPCPGGGGGGAGSGATNNPGTAGLAPGGGGGGTYSSATSGAGANGQVRLTYPGGAPTNSGAAAVPGGGGGGAGGNTPNSTGAVGAQPGGGGGGANSSGTSETAGSGGAGRIIITPYASAPFKNLIVHRPPLGCDKTFQPLLSVGGGGDAPDGTHEYRMPQPVTGVNADFDSTYTIYLVAASLSGSGSRTITVTVNQYEYPGGPKYALSTTPVILTPAQITNNLITAGVMTLPVKQVSPDNTGGYYTVTVLDSNTADRFYDCIFLDTMGQTVTINEPTSGYINYYIDAPEPNLDIGYILGSQAGRPNSIGVFDAAIISGGAIYIEPSDCDNLLFVYSADALAPAISLSYWPRWFFDRYQ